MVKCKTGEQTCNAIYSLYMIEAQILRNQKARSLNFQDTVSYGKNSKFNIID